MAEQKKDQAPSVSVDALKSAFKEGATPNEKDYGALIDLAAVGSKALGAKDATPTTLEPGAGLKMDKDKLTVSAGNGVTVNDQGVAVKGDGKSVTVTDKGVGVQVKPDGGLTTDGDKGLHVKLGAGVTSTADGLAIHLAVNSGLKAEKTGLAVNVATGLDIDGKGALEVKLKKGPDNYITSDKDGLAITKDGVKAIEAALKSVSLGALKKADEVTSHGFKVDATPNEPNEGVQKQIAEKLNGAFTEGWHLTLPRAALFTALKAFRTTNKAKIYKEGLIAPSAVTGKAGLYNQEGVEYVAGTVIAYKVSPSGEAREVKTGAYTDEDGIYALVGKLGPDGVPKAGDTFEKVTPHALMVLVAQKVVTVVGHWDLSTAEDARWSGNTADGKWTTGPLKDGVLVKGTEKEVRAKEKETYEGKIKEINKTHETETTNLKEVHRIEMNYARGNAFTSPKISFLGVERAMTAVPVSGGKVEFTVAIPSMRGVSVTDARIERGAVTRKLDRVTVAIKVVTRIDVYGYHGWDIAGDGRVRGGGEVMLGFNHSVGNSSGRATYYEVEFCQPNYIVFYIDIDVDEVGNDGGNVGSFSLYKDAIVAVPIVVGGHHTRVILSVTS